MVKLKNNYELKNTDIVSFEKQYTTGQKQQFKNIFLRMYIKNQ